jgi:hypothetical protein
MKQLFAIVASVFALSAVAQGVPTPIAPAKVEVKKATPPAKSEAPAIKDQKATAPVTK